jgi:hypothetical protein
VPDFTLQFIQAVSDWQKGGDATKKAARIKQSMPMLPDKYRCCDSACYRQEAHEKDRVWQLIADDRLPERVAGWTIDPNIAREFKGGVPPAGLHGVIFKIVPPPESIVLNLFELYRDEDFLAATERFKPDLVNWSEGGGRYMGTQAEVILELDSLAGADVFSLGGFIGTPEQLAREFHGREPTKLEIEQIERDLNNQGATSGAQWWLSEEGTRRVLKRVEPHLERLREKKRDEVATTNKS